MAIPHNGNLSNGLMFNDKTHAGEAMDRAYATARIRWEPIMEISQIKGDGETHPLLSTEDEFADYETWDVSNIDGSAPKEEWMLQYEYGRSALKLGLELGEKLGVNPYKFGIDGRQRHTHRTRNDPGGELLRQIRADRALPGTTQPRGDSCR